jgi:hypothetical protein
MGYDLHITRKTSWSDEDGPAIELAEWQRHVAGDPELSTYDETGPDDAGKVASYAAYEGALYWSDGEIRAKHPERPLVIKMVAIAAALGATVQGDDGETYGPDGRPVASSGARGAENDDDAAPASGGLLDRIRGWFRGRRATRELRAAAPPFRVGARVRNASGATGTVLEVDPRAEHGLGRLRVRLDDGREESAALVASGWELEVSPAAPGRGATS